MSNERKRAKARKDAAEAVHTLADAGRIAGGAAASTVAERVSDLSGSVSHGVEDARRALAAAIDPGPSPKTRRVPWIVAGVALTGVAAYAWVSYFRRERPTDPGTPPAIAPPSIPPAEEDIPSNPVGRDNSAG